jgi:ribosomal silencing factor RsfS
MADIKIDDYCELGVKGACVTCDFIIYCNGKWSRNVAGKN